MARGENGACWATAASTGDLLRLPAAAAQREGFKLGETLGNRFHLLARKGLKDRIELPRHQRFSQMNDALSLFKMRSCHALKKTLFNLSFFGPL